MSGLLASLRFTERIKIELSVRTVRVNLYVPFMSPLTVQESSPPARQRFLPRLVRTSQPVPCSLIVAVASRRRPWSGVSLRPSASPASPVPPRKPTSIGIEAGNEFPHHGALNFIDRSRASGAEYGPWLMWMYRSSPARRGGSTSRCPSKFWCRSILLQPAKEAHARACWRTPPWSMWRLANNDKAHSRRVLHLSDMTSRRILGIFLASRGDVPGFNHNS